MGLNEDEMTGAPGGLGRVMIEPGKLTIHDEWEWEPVRGRPGCMRRSCCKAPDIMSAHYPDCWAYRADDEHALPRRPAREAAAEIRLSVRPQTALAARVVGEHAPVAIEHFINRNAEYGDDPAFNLGSRGQYADISRKVQKLKRLLWDGVEEKPGQESKRTIVKELIGHLLMTLDYLENEEVDGW
jgi:hypothetical protein